ncbi:MAG TPA: M20/M25/M40 family metallo-hydrolase [Vicinamibacteria bacterium]|nr:M20/M25/M40 family metallo-hydrolase [Vicinamibacteria bacterium]
MTQPAVGLERGGGRLGIRVLLAFGLVTLLAPWLWAQEKDRQAKDPDQWVTLASRDLRALNASSSSDDWQVVLAPLAKRNGRALVRLRESEIESLSRAMHARFNRCGGFIVHPSLAEALDALEPSAPEAIRAYAIDNAPVVNDLMSGLTSQGIVNMITTLSAYQNRYYTATTGVDAAQWLKTQWESWAAGRSDVHVELFPHPGWAQPSVIATIDGTTQPGDVVVIGGHLDSIRSGAPVPNAAVAPGADDDASGVASFSEVFRVAMAKNYHPQRTVKFMAYAAEEVGLRGSGEIASRYKTDGINVIGVMQLDMTDYKGSTIDVAIMTDFTNAGQNAFVRSLMATYLPTLTHADSQCGYGCSDHASWHNRGFAASIPFESLMSQYNPNIHTENDTLANSDPTCAHALKFSKIAAAYMAELAKGQLGAPDPDTVPPAADILAPSSGATLIGTVPVSVRPVDDRGIARVELWVDGVLAVTDRGYPWVIDWNTEVVANGARTLVARAYDAAGNLGESPSLTVNVNNPPVVMAAYDSTLRAPRCSGAAAICDSGTLLVGRGTMGPEPNQPNTVNNSCADGNSGTFHVDESNERIRVSSLSGAPFAAGSPVRVEATAWVYSTTQNSLDLYYAADAASPSWVFLATLTPTATGAHAMSATYTLPTGSLQAVRARFRYQGSAAACATGSYIDHDDLIFAVP